MDIIHKIENENIGQIEKNVSISKYTTYKVGGIAKAVVYPKDVNSLIKLLRILKTEKVPYKIIGNGSNLLFSDKKYEGILIKLTEFNQVQFFGNKIRVGAGFSLIKLVISFIVIL